MNQVIDFDRIDERGPQSYSGTYVVNASDIDRPEIADGGSVTIEVTTDRGHQPAEYLADGTVAFTADLSCSRCVEPYPFANTSSFHVVFRPRPEASLENEEVEITDSEELDVEFYSERKVPLRDLAMEQIQLSIPMKPLCSEACLGLCPTCGANLTRGECSCPAPSGDERWEALKGFREELAKKNDN